MSIITGPSKQTVQNMAYVMFNNLDAVLLTDSDLKVLSYVYNALHCYLTTDHVTGSLGTQYFLYYRLDYYTYTYVSIGVSLLCHVLLPTYNIPCVCI